jgi:hypothetical protein
VRVDSPISAALVCWGNAWLIGHVGLDEAVDHVERTAGPGLVALDPGLNGRDPLIHDPVVAHDPVIHDPVVPDPSLDGHAEVPLRAFLADLRVEGLRALRLALPAAGDPLGLTGPPSFNSAAIDAGEAVIAVLPDRCVGLIPAADRRGSSYVGTRWSAARAADTPPDLPSLAEAEHTLTAAMVAATDALMSVDGPRPSHPGSLLTATDGALAPGYPGRAHRVAVLSARLAAALHLANQTGLTSGQIATQSEVLRELDRAVRRARVAAHHAIIESDHRS